ncbi:phosphotransferase family protein [Streptomyces sp. NPDC087294]|uniref:phosphotransferase family protein n=1 Tax=Streptomyces sp. NPDC087294 TaxID=3365777 RepID=UPI003827F98F
MTEPTARAGAAGAAPVVVREYGTRYLRITVRHHGDAGFTWLRAPGPAHPRPQSLPPPTVGAALRRVDAAVGPTGAQLALGERESAAPGVVYRVPGAVSVARLLTSGNAAAFQLSVNALADVGRTLRRLHQEPWEPPQRRPHPGVRRLRAWLSGEENAPGATRVHQVARARLGPSLWTRLTDWTEAAHQLPSRPALLHGAPSIGWLVPDLVTDGGRPALLTGEEVTGGDPALDLGWLLGELYELRCAAARGLGAAGHGPPVDHHAAAHALLGAYTGTRTDRSGDAGTAVPPGTARAATLRLAVHIRDFATFVGWHDDLRPYCDLLAETLAADGTPTLRWPTPAECTGENPPNPSPHRPTP